MYMYMYLYIYIFTYIYIHISIYICIFLSINLSICLSVYLSVYLHVYLSVYLSIYVSIDLCNAVCRVSGNTSLSKFSQLVSTIGCFQGKFLWYWKFATLNIWLQVIFDVIRCFWPLCSVEAKGQQEELHVLELI